MKKQGFTIGLALCCSLSVHAANKTAPIATADAFSPQHVLSAPANLQEDAAHALADDLMPHEHSYDDVPVEDILRFVGIYDSVKKNYVESVDDHALFDHALHGLLSGLDAYSEYLDAETYEALLEFTDGEIAQTGLEVRPSDFPVEALWQIETVPKGSPAARAGLEEGMLLHKIDQKSTRSMTQHDINQLLRGAIGTSVQLSVSEQGKHSHLVRVVRATPEDNAIKTKLLDGVLWVKISAFQSQTAQQLQDAIDQQQQKKPVKAVLIDLRDNPGGLLSAAIDIADLFLNEGLIVSTRGRNEPEQRYQAIAPAKYPYLKVVVLINHYSASAAEVLAGALQDQHRATIVGENSYGKGSVQKLWPIAGNRAIKLTVARYYTPRNQLIEGHGVTPDIKVTDIPSLNGIDTVLEAAMQFITPAPVGAVSIANP